MCGRQVFYYMSSDKSPKVNNRGGRGFYPPKKGKSFGEMHPNLIQEWQTDEITPFEVGCGSTIKIQWKCQTCDHEWIAKVSNRGKARAVHFAVAM